jgi:hypothetical protein
MSRKRQHKRYRFVPVEATGQPTPPADHDCVTVAADGKLSVTVVAPVATNVPVTGVPKTLPLASTAEIEKR